MRGVRALAIVGLGGAVLGGCGFSLAFDNAPDGAPNPDGSIGDAPCVSFSTLIDTCELPTDAPLMLTGTHTFDTDTGLLTDPIGTVIPVKTQTVVLAGNGIEVQAIFVGGLALDGFLLTRGARPFAILSTSDVELLGNSVLEVGMGGAGARTACASPAAVGQDDSTGGGGGGGGALGADGGHGGDGDSDGDGSEGAAGGLAIATPSGIIGGCAGGAGGDGDDAGGRGGAGGGAVFVASATRIVIGGTAGINAGGEGGRGGIKADNGDAGGGGGGSGGTILLEAPRVRNDGTLSANGGGGGEGSDNGGSSGVPGGDARLGTASPAGGDGNSSGGAGGAFGGNSSAPSGGPKPTKRPGGGGGGGGSVGFIRILASDMQLGSKVSPTPLL